jgi:regulator of sigma E protease
MNFLLAAAMFAAALSLPAQVGHGPLTVSEVQANSPAEGKLEVGDRIVSADGRTFSSGALDRSRDLTAYVASRAGQKVTLGVVRDGTEREVVVVPRSLTDEQRAQGLGSIGFMYEPARIVEEPSAVDTPVKAIAEGTAAAWGLAIRIPGGLAEAVGGLIGLNPGAADAARGPIGIAEETGRVLEAPLVSQLLFVGVLSINLAVLNVLPFPPLDGGRIAVVLIEAIRRRRLPAEREALIYLTGFAVLIALVILISIQDVSRLLGG